MSDPFRISTLLLTGFLLCGCRFPAMEDASTRRDIGSGWSQEAMREHLGFLNATQQEGRGAGTRGLARTATYVADRMKASGLQPVLVNEYRLQYASSILVTTKANIKLVGPDTLLLVHGKDFLIIGDTPRPDVAFAPELIDLLSSGAYRMQKSVRSERRVTVSSMNIAGYIPGSHPVRRDSLIVILAPVDGSGLQGVASWTDGSDSGVAAAALLEVMRRLARMQKDWSVLEQSVFVVFVSGTRRDCQGPEAVFRSFPWSKKAVVRTIVLEDVHTDASCNWAKILETNGISGSAIVIAGVPVHLASEKQTRLDSFWPRSVFIETHSQEKLASDASRVARAALAAIMEN